MPVLVEEWSAVMTQNESGNSLNPSLTKLMMFSEEKQTQSGGWSNHKIEETTKAALEINENTLDTSET